MRTILETTQVNCCSPVEILCPCQKHDLDQLVNFLYSGEIRSTEESESSKIIENLIKIFGFPENLKRNCDVEYPGSDTVSIDTLSIFDEINDHALDDESFETIPPVKILPNENEVEFPKNELQTVKNIFFTFANLSQRS